MTKVLIVGGYGAFGSRIADRLAGDTNLRLVLAGRDVQHAELLAHALGAASGRELDAVAFDSRMATPEQLREIGADLVINASGPFQLHDYTLAWAAVAAGCHYVDLSDARGFVAGIVELDAAARDAGVLVVSGASTVPALSSAVVDAHLDQFAQLDTIRLGISPGNKYHPGAATTASVLNMIGTPLPMARDGEPRVVRGWSGLHRHRFPGGGGRLMSYADMPDLYVFPQRYAGLRTLETYAGTEVPVFHLGLTALAWARRLGVLREPERLTYRLLDAKQRLSFLGTDVGVMFVEMGGVKSNGTRHKLTWHLIARANHGPYVPATAAICLARKLALGALNDTGAKACTGLLALDDFHDAWADLAIETSAIEGA